MKDFEERLVKIESKLDTLLERNGKAELSEYITERQAMELLNCKQTKLWTLRTTGQLSFTRVGRKVYYAVADIKEMLDKNKMKAYR